MAASLITAGRLPTFFMMDWNLQSRAHACQSCEQPFTDQQPYHTLLFEETASYRRHDVCEACWTAQFAGAPREYLSHWKGVYEAPPPAPPEPIRQETAESLLRKLVEANAPDRAAARYILAVMLERKRILKVRDQLRQEDGRRVFVYEHTGNGDVFTIADPELQLHQLDAVQREVSDLLSRGLDAAPAGETTAPAAAEPASEPQAQPVS
jgi:hypothetical protein